MYVYVCNTSNIDSFCLNFKYRDRFGNIFYHNVYNDSCEWEKPHDAVEVTPAEKLCTFFLVKRLAYIHTYIYIHTFTHFRMHVHIFRYMHTYIHTYIYCRIYEYIYIIIIPYIHTCLQRTRVDLPCSGGIPASNATEFGKPPAVRQM